ncbi:DMT family transporter [Virgibacillus sp. W0430]|uniref:DMT family transporter n=1 Tax=Virgibacillus sp. W0430 TaxID=3391580 RepID=UPI003F44DCCE
MDRRTFTIALLTIIVWSSGFAGIRASILGGFSSGHLVLLRFLVASAVFLLYALLTKNRFRLPHKKDLLHIFILGIIGITFYHVLVTFGQQTVSAGTTSMIIGSAPIFTTLIAVFILKERMELFAWIGLGIGFVGIFLITLGTTGTEFTVSKGIYLVILAAISASFFFVFQKPLFIKYNPIELTAYFTWAGTLPMLVFLPGLFENIQSATLEANIAAIYVGVFPAAICYATWAIALSMGNTASVMSMMYLEPAFAIIIAWFWLDEIPSVLSLIGGLVAISSVAVVNMVGRKKREDSAESAT